MGSTLPELVVSTYSLDEDCKVQWVTEVVVGPVRPLSAEEAKAMCVRRGEIGIRSAWENWVWEAEEAGWLSG